MTTTKKRTQSEAVTDPTDPTARGAEETTTKSIAATGSDQSPPKLLSTAPADAPLPAPTSTATATATHKSTKTHPNHLESVAQTTKSTTTITANGSAPAATTKTCPKKKTPPSAHPNPANTNPIKNPDQTTTDLLLLLFPPKPPPRSPPTEKNKENPSMCNPSGQNPRPKDQKSTSMPGNAKPGTRSGWLERSSGRRGRWRGRLLAVAVGLLSRGERGRDRVMVGAG